MIVGTIEDLLTSYLEAHKRNEVMDEIREDLELFQFEIERALTFEKDNPGVVLEHNPLKNKTDFFSFSKWDYSRVESYFEKDGDLEFIEKKKYDAEETYAAIRVLEKRIKDEYNKVQIHGKDPYFQLHSAIVTVNGYLKDLLDDYFPLKITEQKSLAAEKRLNEAIARIEDAEAKIDNMYLNIVGVLGIFTAISFISISSVDIFGNVFDRFDPVLAFVFSTIFILVVISVLMGAILLLLRWRRPR